MVINGQAVKGAKRLANHLMKDENEKVSILEISGTVANDNLHFALRDMEDIGKLTKSQTGKVLYHANINPRKNEALTPEQYIKACDILMEKLGFEGQPRAIVIHQKEGRQHAHLVVQLTDIEKGKLKTISNNYYKHKEVSRSLEKEFELAKTHEKKTGRSYSQSEAQQSKKIGKRTKSLRALVQLCYQNSRNGMDFRKKLAEHELYLAKGKRFVVIDGNGNPYSLTRQLKSVEKSRAVLKYLEPIKNDLPESHQIQNQIRFKKETGRLENSAEKMKSQSLYQQQRNSLNLVQDRMEQRMNDFRSKKKGMGRDRN
tara:strand:- start:103597 stop:104538 length:942 start_codon:yes stop_codon:yes gene_type:complete